MKDEEESFLITRAKKGDLQAFSQLLSRLQNRLFRVAFLLSGQREEAEDLLQETFLALYQSLPRFSGKSSLYTYTYRILLNIYHKINRKKHPLFLPILKNRSVSIPQSPGESLLKEDRQKRVRKAISKLPSRLQEVIILRYLEELSYFEIASLLRIKEGTIKSRLFKARKVLLKILKNEPF